MLPAQITIKDISYNYRTSILQTSDEKRDQYRSLRDIATEIPNQPEDTSSHKLQQKAHTQSPSYIFKVTLPIFPSKFPKPFTAFGLILQLETRYITRTKPKCFCF